MHSQDLTKIHNTKEDFIHNQRRIIIIIARITIEEIIVCRFKLIALLQRSSLHEQTFA
jgi:hypothetical protein